MSTQSTTPLQKKDLFSPDLEVLQKLTGITVSPPSIPDWASIYNQDIANKCRILALIIQLQQTAANMRNEELRIQDNTIQTFTPIEIKLLNARKTKIKPEDISAPTDILYQLAKQIGIADTYEILDSLLGAGLIEDTYHYEASSMPRRTGYKIRESKFKIVYDLVKKWVQDADKH